LTTIEMKHLRALVKLAVAVTAMFIAVGHGGYQLLENMLSYSDFRLVVAGNARRVMAGKRVNLFVGNSRVMGGVAVRQLDLGDEIAYNLAYNGLEFGDVEALVDAFVSSCDCSVESVFVNAGVLPTLDDSEDCGKREVSDVIVFLSAFAKSSEEFIEDNYPGRSMWLSLFPLLRFNNELFFRALYYRGFSATDQLYANTYVVHLTKRMAERLSGRRMNGDFDVKRLRLFRDRLLRRKTKMTIIIPPYHPEYLKRVKDLDGYIEQISVLSSKLGLRLVDSSSLFMKNGEFFADPVHLNNVGQSMYTKFISSVLVPNPR